jgi:hypothetical protein
MIRKTHDYIHRYHGCWRPGGLCRIEIFQEDGCPPVVICTELRGRTESSITAVAECLAAEVALAHFPAAFEELGEPFVWIEHHPSVPRRGVRASYAWVSFASYAPRVVLRFGGRRRVALGQAHWTPIDGAAAEELIAARRAVHDRGTLVAAAAGAPYGPALSR